MPTKTKETTSPHMLPRIHGRPPLKLVKADSDNDKTNIPNGHEVRHSSHFVAMMQQFVGNLDKEIKYILNL